MGFSIWQLGIVLVIVLLLFGAKRLRNVGSDLGQSVKGFKDAMKNPDDDSETVAQKKIEDPDDSQNTVINEKTAEQDKEKS